MTIAEKIFAWLVQIHRNDIDSTAFPIQNNSSGLKGAMRAVEIVSKKSKWDFGKDDVRCKAIKDRPQFRHIGTARFSVDSCDERNAHEFST